MTSPLSAASQSARVAGGNVIPASARYITRPPAKPTPVVHQFLSIVLSVVVIARPPLAALRGRPIGWDVAGGTPPPRRPPPRRRGAGGPPAPRVATPSVTVWVADCVCPWACPWPCCWAWPLTPSSSSLPPARAGAAAKTRLAARIATALRIVPSFRPAPPAAAGHGLPRVPLLQDGPARRAGALPDQPYPVPGSSYTRSQTVCRPDRGTPRLRYVHSNSAPWASTERGGGTTATLAAPPPLLPPRPRRRGPRPRASGPQWPCRRRSAPSSRRRPR